jgi:hypothetical protein
VRRYVTSDGCAAGNGSKNEKRRYKGDVVLVLGKFGSTCFCIVQQVPLVLLGNMVPILVRPHSAWARRARSRCWGGGGGLK